MEGRRRSLFGGIVAKSRSARERILVLDGEERAALATVRSLHAAGYAVVVTSRRNWSLATASRGVRGVRLMASPLVAPEGYAAEVASVARDVGAQLIIPVTDASAEAILQHRYLLPVGAVVPFAPLDIYRAASDKLHVHKLACGLGIGIEDTAVVANAGDPTPTDAALYPGVLKPHRSVVGDVVRRKVGVRFVADAAACEVALNELPSESFPVLVQRRVIGPGEGFFSARWQGRTVARFIHRRLREKPPAGGVSVLRESMAPDAAFVDACEALLDALEWEGVAMVECKRDVERGGWRLMEINGRFWGSLQLAIDAGVDFPRLLAAAALGEAPEAPPTWRPGVRSRWEWGDVDHLLMRLTRSPAALRLPEGAPSRLGALIEFLTHRPGRDRLEVFRLTDPMPFVVESLVWAGFFR